MRMIWIAAAAAALWSASILPAFAEGIDGSWAGPWYRGMTSGTMVLRIEPDGSGVIQMTNLDNFSEDEVVLSNTEKGEKSFSFRAAGLAAGVFVASTQLSADGNVLDGKGRYDGFAIRFKLKRQ